MFLKCCIKETQRYEVDGFTVYTKERGIRVAFERFVGLCIVLDFLYNAIILNGSGKYHPLEFMGARRVRIRFLGILSRRVQINTECAKGKEGLNRLSRESKWPVQVNIKYGV